MASPATLSLQAQEEALYDAYIVKVIGLVFAASIALVSFSMCSERQASGEELC
jgi:hypothetical protein